MQKFQNEPWNERIKGIKKGPGIKMKTAQFLFQNELFGQMTSSLAFLHVDHDLDVVPSNISPVFACNRSDQDSLQYKKVNIVSEKSSKKNEIKTYHTRYKSCSNESGCQCDASSTPHGDCQNGPEVRERSDKASNTANTPACASRGDDCHP
jgi:hypothetical protein